MELIANFLTLEFTVVTNVSGSVRGDLLGGTLDLNPINVILPNVVTLNLATSLKAKVEIMEIDFDGVEIISLDYKTTNKFQRTDFTKSNFQNHFFGGLTFVLSILDMFQLHKNVRLTLESGSPPGAGLGGSSAMGVTTYKAVAKYLNKKFDPLEAIAKVNSLEAKILDFGPAGYQDYYPALFGGILGLVPTPGVVEVDQLYNESLKNYLEKNLTLVYSGETRLSGINNWEVYKAFFNKDKEVRMGLSKIAELSQTAYQNIRSNKLDSLSELIGFEGEERRKLFPNILTPSMESLRQDLKKIDESIGLKICGAGGGGCFLVTHAKTERTKILDLVKKHQMQQLEFLIEKPLMN